ncbi:MAG: hypothetical protein ACP5QL_05510 [Dictyoglomus sp.]
MKEQFIYIKKKFNEFFLGWPSLEKPDLFLWAFLAYVAALMGDKSRVNTFLNTVNSQYITVGHPWPWYVAEAGWTNTCCKIHKGDNLK